MSDTTPRGVLAYITVSDGPAAVAFYEAAFGATRERYQMADDGKRLLHATLAMNGGVLMISDDFPEYTGGVSQAPGPAVPRGIVLHMQVDDCDVTVKQAEAAGAVVTMPPADMFWGDRYALVRDPFHHVWSIANTLTRA